jgi:hypothetical protein
MVGTYPVFMTLTNDLASDSLGPIKQMEALQKMNANIESYSSDGDYDSFLNHVYIWLHLKAKPVISYHQIL